MLIKILHTILNTLNAIQNKFNIVDMDSNINNQILYTSYNYCPKVFLIKIWSTKVKIKTHEVVV
jgi:hypothetical protein